MVGGGPTSIEFASELHDFLTVDVSRWYPEHINRTSVIVVEAGKHLLGIFTIKKKLMKSNITQFFTQFYERIFLSIGTFDDSLSGYVEKLFAKRNVNVLTGSAVAKVEGNTVTLTSAKEIPFGVCVWSTGNKALDFVQNLGLPLSKDGRILVNENLKVEGMQNRFHEKFVYFF